MAIKEFYCKFCGHESEEIYDIHNKIENIPCDKCFSFMDIKISNSNFKLRGLGWGEDGYSTDIDDCEEQWAKNGKAVAPHVKGKENFYERTETEIMDKNRKFFVSKGRAK
jgi:transcription elongation factor Elf1